MAFKDRQSAGAQLAKFLGHYRHEQVVVYGLPRGGVVVAAEVAKYLNAPLDVLIARKIGHPFNPEYAIGAASEANGAVWNESQLSMTTEFWREQQTARAKQEVRRSRQRYQGDQPPVEVAGRIAIVVDDGIATGLTLMAALKELHHRKPGMIVVAVPVAPLSMPLEISGLTTQVYVLEPLSVLGAIGVHYQNFEQVTDEEVRQLLQAYRGPAAEPLDVPALNSLLGTVGHYPVSNGELLDRAQRLHAPTNVVAFFESIPGDVQYEDKTDIMQRAGESELLMEEERLEPPERLREEDL